MRAGLRAVSVAIQEYYKPEKAECHNRHLHSRRGKWSPTYYSWAAMMQRCTNPHRNVFHLYGGRGISVCDRWTRFALFLEDMGERPVGRSLGRIDPNGDYCPENCAWQSDKEQARNRRSGKLNGHDATRIRALYREAGLSQRELGRMFGVSKTLIRNIVTGMAWA